MIGKEARPPQDQGGGPGASERSRGLLAAIGSQRRFLVLSAILLATVALVHGPAKRNFGCEARLFYDPVDLTIYARRGQWYPAGARPYSDVFSEYPQLATYFFAVPYAVLGVFHLDHSRAAYQVVFSGLMAICLLASIRLLYSMLPARKWLAFLMLMPATLFFTLNRYDILPAALALFSYAALARDRFRWAALLLALGVLAKWYLLVLLPIYAQYAYRRERRIPYSMLAVFAATGLGALLFSACHSGWEGLMVPYRFHSGRGPNSESLFYLVRQPIKVLAGYDLAGPWVYGLLLGLQFLCAPLSLLFKIDSQEKVVSWSALAILSFMLFAKFYSPQWILWILPFLLLAVRDARWLALVVALDLATYFCFPIAFDLLRPRHPAPFPAAVAIKTAILALAIAMLVRDLLRDLQEPKLRDRLRRHRPRNVPPEVVEATARADSP
jgi:hypothetical protein